MGCLFLGLGGVVLGVVGDALGSIEGGEERVGDLGLGGLAGFLEEAFEVGGFIFVPGVFCLHGVELTTCYYG